MLSEQVLRVLNNCTIKDTVLYLPDNPLDRDLYLSVAKQIGTIGGKWKGGKVKGFVFSSDPTALLQSLIDGNYKNPIKEFQLFYTPQHVFDEYIWPAIFYYLKPGMKILEPSAGSGNMLTFLFEKAPYIRQIDCCEILEINRLKLDSISGSLIIGHDFLKIDNSFNDYYDLIVANPPFAKNQDIDHIYKMFDFLKPGGKIVSIASCHWHNSSNKKESAFKDWVNKYGYYSVIEQGAFKESGTMVASCLVIIDKPMKIGHDIPPISSFGIKIG